MTRTQSADVEGPGTIVARHPPRARKLSLTVGMLTLNEMEAIEQSL